MAIEGFLLIVLINQSTVGLNLALESVGRISIQADDATHGMVYISGGGEGVTIQCTGAQVDDSAVRIQDNYNTIWTFKDGALYKNGSAVL